MSIRPDLQCRNWLLNNACHETLCMLNDIQTSNSRQRHMQLHLRQNIIICILFFMQLLPYKDASCSPDFNHVDVKT